MDRTVIASLFAASGFKELWIAGGVANAMLWFEVLAAGLHISGDRLRACRRDRLGGEKLSAAVDGCIHWGVVGGGQSQAHRGRWPGPNST